MTAGTPLLGRSAPRRTPPPRAGLRRAMIRRAWSHGAPAVAVVVVVLAGWQIYVEVSSISPVTLPSPWRVLREGREDAGVIARHARVTLGETAAGLTVSIALALALGTLIDFSAPLRRALYPLLVASQTIPIVAVAPLLIIWFGFGMAPKIIVVTLYTFFPIVVGFAAGLASVDRESLNLMRTFGATRWQTYRYVKVPASLPSLFTGLRIGATYAVVGAIFGEWAGAVEGLGVYMQVTKNAFRTDLLFAAIVVTAVLSFAIFALVLLAERWLVPWRRPAEPIDAPGRGDGAQSNSASTDPAAR